MTTYNVPFTDDDILASGIAGKRSYVLPEERLPSNDRAVVSEDPLMGSMDAEPVYQIQEPKVESLIVQDKIARDSSPDDQGFWNQFYGSLESTIFQDNPRLSGRAIEGLGRASGIDSMRELGENIVAEFDASPPEEKFVPRVSNYKDVDGLNAALDYVGSTVGQGVGSIAMTVGGGLVGAGAGAAVGSVVPGAGTVTGAVVGGATVGGVGGSFLLNYGDTYEYMMETEGMDPEDAALYAIVPGTIMAGLDAYGVGRLLGPAKGELASNIIKRTGQLALRGAGTEGVTESAQQVIQEFSGELAEAAGYATADIEFAQRFDNVINSMIAGALTGGAMGGATSPFKKPTEAPPPSDVETAPVETAPVEAIPEAVETQGFDTIEDYEGLDPEDLMMERRQDYYEGIADLQGDPLDLERLTTFPPAPADLQLELEELARFEGLKTIPEAMERKAEIESDFGSIEAYEAQRERERSVEIDQPDQTLEPQKYELHSFDPDYTPPSMSKDNSKPLSRSEYNSLREQLDINRNDPRFSYGGEIINGFPEGHRYAEKRISQPNLMENPDFDQSATKVYSETGLKGFRALIGRTEAGPRSHVDFWASDDIDLAIGQGGRGYMLEIDPRLVNGFQADTKGPMMEFQAAGILKGSEYKITQSVRGAVTALIFRNPRQIQAVLRGAGQPGRSNNLATYLSNAFDFENPIEFEFMRQGQSENVKGLRVPRKTQRLLHLETDPDADSDPDPKPPVILKQSPVDVVQELTDEAQAEGIEKLRSLIKDLPEDSKQAYDIIFNRLDEMFGNLWWPDPGQGIESLWSESNSPQLAAKNAEYLQETLAGVPMGTVSPEQYRLMKYLYDNPDELAKIFEAGPPNALTARIELKRGTHLATELVVDAYKIAQELGIQGVTVDDIYSGRFATTVKEAGGKYWMLEMQAEWVRKDFKKHQSLLDKAGVDYTIKMDAPSRAMLVNELIKRFRTEIWKAKESGDPVPPVPNLEIFMTDRRKKALPRKGAGYDTFGVGAEEDYARYSAEGDRSITLEKLFEGVETVPERPAMGVTTPEDVGKFVESPTGTPTKRLRWYERAAARKRGRGQILRQTLRTRDKLGKAWKTDSGIATISDHEYDIVKEFVAMVGTKRLENIAFAIEPEIATGMMLNEPLGLYFFGKDIVGISHSTIASGRFVGTTIHELWHGLSQYLPDNTVNDLYTQYARERGEFMRQNPEAFDRSGNLTDINMAKNQNTYRFSSFDEWVVEKMKDLSIEDASQRILRKGKGVDPTDLPYSKPWQQALRALADLVRSHYNQIKALFGRDVARATYLDFMQGKYMEQVRSSPLADVIEITAEDEAMAAERWSSYLDALDADEGVEAAAQSMSEETERFIEQMVVGPAEVVTDEEFKALASQPPAAANPLDPDIAEIRADPSASQSVIETLDLMDDLESGRKQLREGMRHLDLASYIRNMRKAAVDEYLESSAKPPAAADVKMWGKGDEPSYYKDDAFVRSIPVTGRTWDASDGDTWYQIEIDGESRWIDNRDLDKASSERPPNDSNTGPVGVDGAQGGIAITAGLYRSSQLVGGLSVFEGEKQSSSDVPKPRPAAMEPHLVTKADWKKSIDREEIGPKVADTRRYAAAIADEFDDLPKAMAQYATDINIERSSLLRKFQNIQPDDKVTLYRAVSEKDPTSGIQPGDWVALERSYAEEHGFRYGDDPKIVELEVPAKDVIWAGTSFDEWHYAPQYARDSTVKSGHEAFVKDAIREGKEVPEEVLKDYPHLAAKPPESGE